jgi:LDH2 family malate/lactate/ureidoglycolate dehydrogenase
VLRKTARRTGETIARTGEAVTSDEARARLRALGLDAAAVEVLVAHFADAEARGKLGHGFSRIPWLETQPFDPQARAVRRSRSHGVDRWDGTGALGYLTLAAICDDVLAEGVEGARLIVASPCFPTGALGYWVRRLAQGGYVALLTATSPRRLPAPSGGVPLTGTNPLAIAIPSHGGGDPVVADVSMGAVTHGDVLAGRARPDDLVPFGGDLAHKAFALAVGLELLVGALAGPEHSAVLLVARPEHDPVPAFRALAAGLRLPGDA